MISHERLHEFLRSDAPDPPVTVVREMHVRPAHGREFEEQMSTLIQEAIRQPGHLGATIVRPRFPGDTYRFVYKFERRSQLLAWHASETRARLVAPIARLVEFDRYDEFPGLETWFELPGHEPPPPKWKTTLMSWTAIYVLVVAVSYALQALKFEASIPVRALVLSGLVVPLVAYVVGPWLGRRLHGWLHAGSRHTHRAFSHPVHSDPDPAQSNPSPSHQGE